MVSNTREIFLRTQSMEEEFISLRMEAAITESGALTSIGVKEYF